MALERAKKLVIKNKTMSYQDVANYFLAYSNEVGEPITNLKLQKLVYYAQAWYLANNKKPLFDDAEFQAWVHGPVIPDLYEKYKDFGSAPIKTKDNLKTIKKKMDSDKVEFLDEVIKVYMPAGAYELERMTHQEGPWIEARGECEPDQRCDSVITNDAIQKYYAQKIA